MKQTMTYEEWIEALKTVATNKFDFTEKGISQTDWNAFRDYYNDGYSPEGALLEDFSNA